MLLFLYMVGVDLYSSLVIFGVTVLFAAIIQALHINEAMSNLIPLAISNAIHIGEIVAVTRAGFKPGHDPENTHVGFVEGVTWSHVVIRDLSRKQIFVPHQELQTKILSNWSRRPSKPIHLKMVIIPSIGGGVDKFPKLMEFIRQWMRAHPDIAHNDYQKVGITFGGYGEAFLAVKCIVTDVDEGGKVRNDLTITIMKACHRMNIMLIDPGHADWKLNEDLDLNANDQNRLDDLDDLMPTYGGYQQ